jgi:hypothetical protein
MALSAQESVTVWDEGDSVPLNVAITNIAGNAADPVNGVTGEYMKPDGTKVAIVWTHEGTGSYSAEIPVALGEFGDWWWSVATDGADSAIPKMYEERTFYVRKRVIR